MSLSETSSTVISIGESESEARQLALRHSFRQGISLPLLPRVLQAETMIEQAPEGAWLSGNRLFLGEIFVELKGTLRSLEKVSYPLLMEGPFLGYPRVFEIAVSIIHRTDSEFSIEAVAEFVKDYQDIHGLEIRELWALDTMLTLAAAEALAKAAPERQPRLIEALRAIQSAPWQEFFESQSRTERVLREDPTGFYARMDFATRDRYRHVVEGIAKFSECTEEEVAKATLDLARAATSERERHVGFHLIDRGAERLKAALQYRPGFRARFIEALVHWPTASYLITIEVLSLALAGWLLSLLRTDLGYLGLIVFLLATEPVVGFVNALATYLLPPRTLPKLDFSDGIPADCVTMAVVPTLLLSEEFVRKLLRDLEVRFLANRDPRLCFALLTDLPDSSSKTCEQEHLAEDCAEGIRQLNRRYGTDNAQPFYLFHRSPEWNPKQSAWMGLERKRGKLIALNNLLRGARDAFSIKEGDLSVLPTVRFVITLDSDTGMPRGSAQRLAGTLAHPLNQAVVDPRTNIVVEGYGILQPRVGISIDSARKSRLALLYSGQTGYDLYSTAVSDVYQDLFGEGSYVGKGIYDVDVFQKILTQRFPDNLLLSHDLIEGAHARAALVSDIEMIDDYPSHYQAWTKRKHRWTRGDWQIMLWLLPRVPDCQGKLTPNPLSVISLWKIVDNLRRSLLEIGLFVLLLAGWTGLAGGAAYWTGVVVLITALPIYTGALFSLLATPRDENWCSHLADTLSGWFSGHLDAVLRLTFLPHQALIMLDAIGRSIFRTTVTGRDLLEWESAAQAELGAAKKPSHIESLLWLSSPLALLFAAMVMYFNPASMPYAVPFLTAWLASPVIALWLNAPIIDRKDKLKPADRKFLLDVANKTWKFFETYATAERNWLAPDNVREEDGLLARRVSPTNLGLLLNSHLAALDLEFVTSEQFTESIKRVFESMSRMERVRGHFLNWYDTDSLAPLSPRYVSTVDSGNLAAALIALRQGLLEIEGTAGLAEQAWQWIQEINFAFLLKPKRKLFYTGWNADSGQFDNYEYDLLASESRTASLIAIAKNDVTYTHWARLGRRVLKASGKPVLLSWSGTMFEYLMPHLWLRRYADTLLDQTLVGAVNCQEQYGRAMNLPWGVSECAGAEKVDGGDHRYYAFGVPDLAANPDQSHSWVIAPYATLLALDVSQRSAIRNLQSQAKRGWLGPFGFYESADFSPNAERETIVKVYMAHHHGMSLVALDNVLNNGVMQQRFHRDPMIESTALLLHEKPARRAPKRKPRIASKNYRELLNSETELHAQAS